MSANTAISRKSKTNCVNCCDGFKATFARKRSKSADKHKLNPRNMKLPPPKRPMNAYNFFFKDQRKKLLGSSESPSDDIVNGYTVKRKRAHVRVHGKLPLVALVKLIAKKWRVLGAEELQQYSELAKVDSRRYKNDVEVYNILSTQASKRCHLFDHLGQENKSVKPKLSHQPFSRTVDNEIHGCNSKRCSVGTTSRPNPSAAPGVPSVTHPTFCMVSIKEPISDILALKRMELEREYKGFFEDHKRMPELEPIDLNVMRSYSIHSVELSLSMILQITGVDLCSKIRSLPHS
jgi:hypothetical protein